MPFNINRFQGEIDKRGISRTDHYEIIVTPPWNPLSTGTRDNPNAGLSESIMFRARSMNLPGRFVAQTEFFEHGSEYKIASASNYQNINIEVLCNENLGERDFFLSWQDLAVGKHRVDQGLSRNGFFGNYYKDYVGSAKILIYDERGRNTRTITLQEVFPVGIMDIRYDWGTSQHAIVPIDLSYRYFFEDRSDFSKQRYISPDRRSNNIFLRPGDVLEPAQDPNNRPSLFTNDPDTQTVPDMPELDIGIERNGDLETRQKPETFREIVDRFLNRAEIDGER